MTAETPKRVTGFDVHGITATSNDELEELEVYEELVDLNRKRQEEEEGSGGTRPPMVGGAGQGSGASSTTAMSSGATAPSGVAAGGVQVPGGVGAGGAQAGLGAGAAQASGGFGGLTGREAASRSSANGGAMSVPPIGMTAAAGSATGGGLTGYVPGVGSAGVSGGTQASGSSGRVAGYSPGTIAADGRVDDGGSGSGGDGRGGSRSGVVLPGGGGVTGPGVGTSRGEGRFPDPQAPAGGGSGGGTGKLLLGNTGGAGIGAAGGAIAGGAAATGGAGGWAGSIEASPEAIEARSVAWQEWAARMEDISRVLAKSTAEGSEFGLVQTAAEGYHDSQATSTKWSAQGSVEFQDFAEAVSDTGRNFLAMENESCTTVKKNLAY